MALVRPGTRPVPAIFLLAILGSGLGSLPLAAVAQDAETLIKQGVQLRRSGDDRAALEPFKKAHAQTPTGRSAAQLGLCEQALGQWVEAERELKKALSLAPSDAWVRSNQAVLEKSLAAVRTHLATLELHGSPVGAEITVEGRVVGRLPLEAPLRVVPGVLTVGVSAQLFSSALRKVVIEPGQHIRENIDLAAVATAESHDPLGRAAPVASRTTPPDLQMQGADGKAEARVWMRPGAVGAAALAGGALTLAVVETVVARREIRRFNRIGDAATTDGSCDADLADAGSPRCGDLLDSYQGARRVALGAYVVGGALAVTSGLLFYLSSTSSQGQPERRAYACAPAGLQAGLVCALRF